VTPPEPFDPASAEVFAAGGVPWRRRDGGLEVLLVHRPHREDWSLPKGKVDPGESVEQTALREVLEETGLDCTLGEGLGTVSYYDAKQRSKTVWYWVMHLAGGEETLNDEVDEMRWLPVADAARLTSYGTDREVLERFAAVADRLG